MNDGRPYEHISSGLEEWFDDGVELHLRRKRREYLHERTTDYLLIMSIVLLTVVIMRIIVSLYS